LSGTGFAQKRGGGEERSGGIQTMYTHVSKYKNGKIKGEKKKKRTIKYKKKETPCNPSYSGGRDGAGHGSRSA
jgi:hypothetical protein